MDLSSFSVLRSGKIHSAEERLKPYTDSVLEEYYSFYEFHFLLFAVMCIRMIFSLNFLISRQLPFILLWTWEALMRLDQIEFNSTDTEQRNSLCSKEPTVKHWQLLVKKCSKESKDWYLFWLITLVTGKDLVYNWIYDTVIHF